MRARRTLALAAAAIIVAAACVTQLPQTASPDLLVGDDSEIGQAQTTLEDTFGGEPVVLVLSGDLSRTLSPQGLVTLLGVESRVAKLRGVRSVYGPATFLNQTIIQAEAVLTRELGETGERAIAAADAARTKARAEGRSAAEAEEIAEAAKDEALGPAIDEYQQLLLRVGSVGLPALSNQAFVNTVVFGSGVEPKERFQWLFPDAQHAVVIVRPEPGLSEAQTLALGRGMERIARSVRIEGVRTSVGGFPLLAAALERETRSEILRLGPIAVVAMLLLLLLTLRRRRGRFAPLVLALGGTLVATGLSWPLGLGLSVSTVAALPVVLGLAIDFAVQLQARYWHERRGGAPPDVAATTARASVGPTLALAAGAMAIGFLTLLVSSVPLLDRLGAFLALGTLTSVGMVLLVGPALLVWLDRGPVEPLRLSARLPDLTRRVRPGVVALVAGIALGGLALSGQTRLESDLRTLSPAGMSELEGVEALQQELGTSGQVRIAIEADDVTAPEVVRWMGDTQARAAELAPTAQPGPNLADLVSGGGATPVVDRESVDGILKLLPEYFLDAVISEDRTVAELSYGIPLVSVEEQGRIVDRLRTAAADPPDGVSVTATGLVAAAASSTDSLESTRPGLLLLAAALIALVLYAVWRDVVRIGIVLAPALLSAGVVAFVLLVVDLSLSPLGAALELLVLAVGLEFAMLLEMRYREARDEGRSPAVARAEATREIGGAVALSAGTVAAGFAVLVFSRLPLLSQLGWLVALELALSLLAALVVVPALCERRDLAGPRPAGRTRGTGLADRIRGRVA